MLHSISDSEDELNVSPLRLITSTTKHTSSDDPTTTASTTGQLRAAARELFQSSAWTDADTMPTARKRRKTCDEPQLVKDRLQPPERSQSSVASMRTQVARESVLFSGGGDSQVTIRYSTGEHERLITAAIGNGVVVSPLEVEAGGDETGVLDGIITSAQLLHNDRSSSSIPWSLESPVDLYENAPAGKLRRPGSRQPSSSIRQSSSASRQPSSSIRQPSSSVRQPSSSASVNRHDSNGLQQEVHDHRPSRSHSAQAQNSETNWTLCGEETSKKRKRRTATETGLFDESLSEELQRRAKEARRADSSGSKRASTGSSVVRHDTVTGIESTESSAPHGDTTDASNEPPLEQSTDHEPPMEVEVQAEESTAAPVVDTSISQAEESPDVTSTETSSPLPPTKVVEVVIQRPLTEFATPTAPASASRKPGKTKKSRSHTTIFEDHVGLLDRPDPSPNLLQQQATRKRGRGRPKKIRAEEQPKPIVQEEPEPEPPQADTIVVRDDDEEDLLATGDQHAVAEPEVIQPPVAEVEETTETPPQSEVIVEEPQISAGKENASWSSGKEVTPPPRDTSPRPMHSPIRKNAGGVSLRVGLSKRQRIQPLLRICKR